MVGECLGEIFEDIGHVRGGLVAVAVGGAGAGDEEDGGCRWGGARRIGEVECAGEGEVVGGGDFDGDFHGAGICGEECCGEEGEGGNTHGRPFLNANGAILTTTARRHDDFVRRGLIYLL